MPGARAIKAGEAFVEMTVRNAALLRGLRVAQAHLRMFREAVTRMGRGLLVVGGAMATFAAAGVAAFGKLGDAVAKAARRTGLTTEAFSELKFAASQSDASAEDLVRGLLIMNRTLLDAERGLSTANDALRALGLSVASLRGLSPERRFLTLADALSRVEDPGRRAALAMMVFGRGGAKLLPLLSQGAAGIEALRKKARALGLSMGSKDAVAAERFSDALDALKSSLKMAFFRVGAALAPVLTDLAERLAAVVGVVSRFIEKNRELIISFAKIALGVLAAGGALMGLGKVFGLLGGAAGLVGRLLPVIGAGLSALMSPLGLVISAVVALGGVLLHVTGYGGKLLDWLGGRFAVLKDDALRAFGAIGKALAGGNIALAARILWLTVKLEWRRGVNALTELWVGFKEIFLRTATNAWYGALRVLAGAWAGLQVTWATVVNGLSQAWNWFVFGVLKVWNRTSGALRKAWAKLRSFFDDSVDYEAEKTRIETEMEIEARGLDAEQKRRSEAATAEYRRRMAEIGQEYEATAAELDREAAAAHAKRQKKHRAQLAAARAELEAARKEWRDALAEADQESRRTAREGPPKGRDFKAALRALPGTLSFAAAGLEALGTFNAVAAFGLGVGTTAERIANATEQTAKNTGRLLDEVQEGGIAFE